MTNTGRPNSAASSRRKYLLSQARGLLALPASNARGHAMRAAFVAMMLMIGSKAEAESGNLCHLEWWKFTITGGL